MIPAIAPVAELVDAPDSKSGDGNIVLVRSRPGAPAYAAKQLRLASQFVPPPHTLATSALHTLRTGTVKRVRCAVVQQPAERLANAPPPLLFARRGRAFISFLPRTRGSGAPRGALGRQRLAAPRAFAQARSPLGAPLRHLQASRTMGVT